MMDLFASLKCSCGCGKRPVLVKAINDWYCYFFLFCETSLRSNYKSHRIFGFLVISCSLDASDTEHKLWPLVFSDSVVYLLFFVSLRSNTCSETDFVYRWLMHTLDRFVQRRRRHRRRPMPWLIWRNTYGCWNDWILFIHELGRFFSCHWFLEHAVGAWNVRIRIRRWFSNRKLCIDNSYCLEKWVWTKLFVCVEHIFYKWRSETNQIGTHNYVIRYVKNVQT